MEKRCGQQVSTSSTAGLLEEMEAAVPLRIGIAVCGL